jgi:hypothetical protein
MRAAGFGLLGFLSGAMAGFLAALLLMILWYDVLAMGREGGGGDGMSGLNVFILVAPSLALIGGILGAIGFVRRARNGKSAPLAIVVFVLLLALFLATFTMFGL